MARDRAIDPITPRQVSLAAAGFVGILVGAMGLVILRFFHALAGYWWSLVIALVAAVATYATMSAVLERFITARLRVLFRMVHDLRTGTSSAPPVDMGSDVLGQVQATVEDWAQEKGTEIAALKQREGFRREFIGNLSHELKTPLFNIQGYILTLLEGGLEDQRVNRDFLERAARSADRLIKIVEDMDMIAKLESGVMVMHMEPVELGPLVREQLREVELHAQAKGILVSSEVADDVTVMADPGRLAQLVTNLLNNAVYYGRQGGQVIVRSFNLEGGQVLVEVSDNGIGIAAEHLPRLFERFYRVGASRSRHEGGSGLGLAIVKHIIEAHGQTITARSREGEGATFSFTLAKAR